MTAIDSLAERLAGSAFQGYTYGYPHKTAYRPLRPARALRDVWMNEPKQALDLYIHIPYCTMRCGFCNLFTSANPADTTLTRLCEQLERESDAVARAVGPATFAHFAIGGGTPTILSPDQLAQLFTIAATRFGIGADGTPISVEASPETVTPEKLHVLKQHGVTRLSLGVQSFDEAETRALGRPQRRVIVDTALAEIAAAGFQTLNIDLIYGAAGQTRDSWLRNIDTALDWRPDEICLYPLYVRPLTGLGRLDSAASLAADVQLDFYRLGRDHLMAKGFVPANMRLFRRGGSGQAAARVHKCLTDGTVGVGCGARSITTGLHYSSEYAVNRGGVQQILAGYLARAPSSFEEADYGANLDADDQRRRHIVLHLMEADGISRTGYRDRYGRDPLDDFPELAELQSHRLAVVDAAVIRLTLAGLERSDVIGPWLYSIEMRTRMEAYAWR